MTKYELLEDMINFAKKELEDYKRLKNGQDTFSLVTTSLFRSIVEQSEGVLVSAKHGLKGPAVSSCRGTLEVSLALRYILNENDPETKNNRAIAYEIGHHKNQIKAWNKDLMNDEKVSDEFKNKLVERLQHHQNELTKEDFAAVLEEYERTKKGVNTDRKGKKKNDFLPKWYALYNGPSSINALAKHLNEQHEKEKNKKLENIYYGLLSVEAHNYTALSDVRESNGNKTVYPVNYPKGTEETTEMFKLIPTRGLLYSGIKLFTLEVFPEYIDECNEYIREWKKYWNP